MNEMVFNKESLQFIYLQEYVWIPINGEFSFNSMLSNEFSEVLFDKVQSIGIDIIRLDYFAGEQLVGSVEFSAVNQFSNDFSEKHGSILSELNTIGITVNQIRPIFLVKNRHLKKYLLKDKEIPIGFCSRIEDREEANNKLSNLCFGAENQLTWFYSYFQWYVINKAKHSAAKAVNVIKEAEMAIYSSVVSSLNGNADILQLIRTNIDQFITQAELEQLKIGT